MSKFHFICLYGIDYDIDMLSHWIKHYKDYRFDSYNIWLHTSIEKDRDERYEHWTTYFESNGFTVQGCVYENYFRDGRVRARAIGKFPYSVSPDDYIICADSDEIQDVPINYKQIASQYDIMKGDFIDCWSDRLSVCDPDIPLDEQYPKRGFFFRETFKPGFFPDVIKTKILCSKASVSVSWTGSHDYSRNHNQHYKICTEYNVLHYTFRDSLPHRMCGKRYYSKQFIKWIMEYFKYDKPVEGLREKIETEHSKGWVI